MLLKHLHFHLTEPRAPWGPQQSCGLVSMAGSQPFLTLQPCEDVISHSSVGLVICGHFGGRHSAPCGVRQKAGAPLVSGIEFPSTGFPRPTFCHVPSLVGLLILLNEDCMGLHPGGRMSSWCESRKTSGWKNWSSSRLVSHPGFQPN